MSMMSKLLRGLVELALLVPIAMVILLLLTATLSDVAVAGLDDHTKSGLMLIAAFVLALLIADYLCRKLFATRPRAPSIGVIVIRGQQVEPPPPRSITARRRREGRHAAAYVFRRIPPSD